MNEFGNQIIFKQLLDRHQNVQVPMIQRDYAQGRSTEEEVREEFLRALHDALLLPVGHDLLPLNLDFIYGSVEGEEEKNFLPLDGQQRLTTLFLLHWYLAWNDGVTEDFQEIFCPQKYSLFSYSVRPSSTEFFDALVNFIPKQTPSHVSSLRLLLTNQPWYFRYWRLDPTIQSSLTMLESIHVRFRDTKDLYSRLLDEQQPAITFQLLDLDNFGLSDDLYIKMNARGKPLTPFETFKARYEQELGNQFESETRVIGKQSFPISDYFARRMDTHWADFFWKHREKNTMRYDDAVMNLFRAVAMITRDPESESYLDDISSLRNRQLQSSYSFFHGNGWLDKNFSETLFVLLEAWSKVGAEFTSYLPNAHYFNEEKLFTKIVKEPTTLSFTELVQFVGYVAFMREHEDDIKPDVFQEWMRIVINLSVNTSYERLADIQRSIAGLLKQVINSGEVLKYFSVTEKPITGFSLQQIAEEKLKSELLQVDSEWKPLIDRAEGHGYFKGQIMFLLDFCGASEKRNNSEDINWGSDEHVLLRDRFDYYLKKSEQMFNTHGLADPGEYRWERALLTIGDYTLSSGRNKSFLVNSSTEQASWKRLLRGGALMVQQSRKMLQELWDNLTEDTPLVEQLDTVINKATKLERWRSAFVHTPEAIFYCKNRAFRRNSDENIYLLKRVQMNGAHAELFTYCLYHDSLMKLKKQGSLSPLKLWSYQEVNETDIEPSVLLTFDCADERFRLSIEYAKGCFNTCIHLASLEEFPEIQRILCDSADFMVSGSFLLKSSLPANVQEDLLEIARVLTINLAKE